MEALVGDLLPLHEGDHLEDLGDLHEVGPGHVGDGGVDDAHGIGVDHGGADEEVEDDVHADGVGLLL